MNEKPFDNSRIREYDLSKNRKLARSIGITLLEDGMIIKVS
jgi:hypothetical protein